MDRKNVIIIVLVVLLAALLAGGGVYLWQSSDDESSEASENDESAESDETAATDESADVAQDEIIDQAIPTISDEDAIRQAMADKYSKDIIEVDLMVGDNNGEYARGTVIFEGDVSGGWWLAAKTDGVWEIVDDGNGVILCSVIEPYDFPASMVQECYDEATSTLVTR